jgi:hypothetical protein
MAAIRFATNKADTGAEAFLRTETVNLVLSPA